MAAGTEEQLLDSVFLRRRHTTNAAMAVNMVLHPDHLGAAIRFHREAAGLSRRELSELAGVGTTALYDLEHGKETVQLRTLLRIFDALNMAAHLDGPLMDRFEAEYAD